MKNPNIRKVLILGSGALKIGQAGESSIIQVRRPSRRCVRRELRLSS